LECNDINHRGKYYFNVDGGTSIKWRSSDISINELQAGNVISIAYTGRAMETAPAKIEKVLRIELLDDELNLPEVDSWIKDISLSEAEEIHTIINGNGYTWTIYAPNGYWGDSAIDFIHEICQ